MRLLTLAFLSLLAANLPAQAAPLTAPGPPAVLRDLDARIALVTPKAVPWRRVLHAHPELSLSAERTDRVVPTQLKPLGLEVRSNLGGWFSVVGIRRGGRLRPAVPTSVKVLSALAIDALAHGVAPLGTKK